MKVTVDEQPQRFWLALDDGWTAAIGHGLQVGDMNFRITMHGNTVNVTEITTGCRVVKGKLSPIEFFGLSEKVDVLSHFEEIGANLADYFSKNDIFERQTTKYRKIVLEKLGPMPAIQYVDDDELAEYLKGESE